MLDRPRPIAQSPTAVTRTRTLAAWLAALALAIVLSGLPRLLVLCKDRDGSVHVEWVHEPGACCTTGGGHALPSGADGGLPLLAAAPHCEHHEFAVDLASPGRGVQASAADAPPLLAVLPPQCFPAAVPPRTRLASATGPPRPDERLRLRATTLLLL